MAEADMAAAFAAIAGSLLLEKNRLASFTKAWPHNRRRKCNPRRVSATPPFPLKPMHSLAPGARTLLNTPPPRLHPVPARYRIIQLAAAGFHYIGSEESPDCTSCFMCNKQLDGWDPSDDPEYVLNLNRWEGIHLQGRPHDPLSLPTACTLQGRAQAPLSRMPPPELGSRREPPADVCPLASTSLPGFRDRRKIQPSQSQRGHHQSCHGCSRALHHCAHSL
jgi:hypothetical protein